MNEKKVAFFLFMYALLIRFPFFFRDYVDRDESTFILMGQSWVDGHLPYTMLWDVKPPLTFFFFAALIYLFGKSFIVIRLAGVILVTVSSFFTYKIAASLYQKKMALTIAFLAVVLQSLFGSIQGVMSEHLVMAFFMPALWLLLAYPNNAWYNLLCGVLLGAALMVKLNMAYVVLLIGVFIVAWGIYQKKTGETLVRGMLKAFGFLFVVGLCFFPYYLNDLEELWWRSVVEAPLQYAGARTYHPFRMAPYIVPILLFILWGWKKRFLDFKNKSVLLLVLVLLGVLLSFLKSGRVNSHYLILLHPIFVILVGFSLVRYSKTLKKVRASFWVLLLFLVPIESYIEYGNIVWNKIEKGSLFNGEGINVPNYLIQNGIDTSNILFLEYHIGYWILGQNPPSKAATQPSNILKDEMFFAYENPRKTKMEELRYLMESVQPTIVITRRNRRVFDKKELEANAFINNYLNDHYIKLDSIDGALIHQRLE